MVGVGGVASVRHGDMGVGSDNGAADVVETCCILRLFRGGSVPLVIPASFVFDVLAGTMILVGTAADGCTVLLGVGGDCVTGKRNIVP